MPVTLNGTPYEENFDGIGFGLPLGWLLYTGATSSSLGTSVSFTTTTTTWGDTTGAFKNFAANDSGLASNENASKNLQDSATDRALGIRQTGTGTSPGFGDPGASFVFNLDNTLGFQNFGLSFKAQILSVQTRSTIWTVDYRVGNSGNFNVLGTYSDPNAFGSSTLNFSNFATNINNQSNQVQIRISALSASTGSSNRDSFGIDDFQLTYNPVGSNSNPPVVTLPSVTTISYTENVSSTIIDAGATVIDTDSPNFNYGSLTVRFTGGGSADDRLAIRNEGTGATQINLDGREIYYGSNKIGKFSGGIGTENLVIKLDANATPEATQALLRNITYANVSENPTINNRTVEFILNDGSTGNSTPVTKTIEVFRVNDAPLIGTTKVLYDGSIDTLPTTSTPDSKGWIYNATSGVIRSNSNGVTTLNTTANTAVQAGFANITQTLNNLNGYIVSFTAQVLAESHNTPTANKNNDGKDDRAGFSVLVVSNDNTKAIELGFWEDRIWAQEDGTTQKNPSLEPDDSPASNFRNLFTQAEFTTFNTKNTSVKYDLAIKDDTYTLFANGNTILSGKLRNYTAFNKLPDTQNPYRRANNIFFGDNTPSAQGNFNLAKVAVTTNSTLPSITVNEDTSVVIPNLRIDDVDAGTDNISVTLSVSQGKLTINNSVSGGVAAGTISNNGTGNVILTSTLSEINATLANATGLIYLGNLDFNGSDTLNISVNDGFNTANKNLAIAVNSVNDRPTFTKGNNQSVRTGVTQTIAGWASSFNSGDANETQSVAGYIVKVVNDVNADIFDVAPTINSIGDLIYTAKSGITASKTATIE
ncbi:MAG: choice-of-anchor Y domain-containing protein, partial [Hassallia sp.]